MTIDEKHLRNWCDAQNLFYLGTVVPEAEDPFKNFKAWLEDGNHAGMTFLERYQDVRQHPKLILEGTKSVVVFGMAYGLGDTFRSGKKARIAQYARLRDYHKQMRKKGETVWDSIAAASGKIARGRVVVDTAPVLERALAAQTHRGFVGKNTLFIHPERGSLFFLGEIFTDLDLAVDRESEIDPHTRTEKGGCGTCKRCQVHCPTGALDTAYKLDANKCISYWTIEHRGLIPKHNWFMLEHYVFGCDICQLVCPYNRKSNKAPSDLIKLDERPELHKIATMSQEQYVDWFGGTPMTRAKREGLMRNALIAMFVLSDPELDSTMSQLTNRSDCSETVMGTIAQIRDEIT